MTTDTLRYKYCVVGGREGGKEGEIERERGREGGKEGGKEGEIEREREGGKEEEEGGRGDACFTLGIWFQVAFKKAPLHIHYT